MSVNCHNSGRICWNTLVDSISYEVKDCNGKLCYEFSLDESKAIHFARSAKVLLGKKCRSLKLSA